MHENRGERTSRAAMCAAAALGAVYAAESICRGKDWPLWEKYGPWITANKLQAAIIAAAVLYILSLALWPEGEQREDREEGYIPCG